MESPRGLELEKPGEGRDRESDRGRDVTNRVNDPERVRFLPFLINGVESSLRISAAGGNGIGHSDAFPKEKNSNENARSLADAVESSCANETVIPGLRFIVLSAADEVTVLGNIPSKLPPRSRPP